MPRVGGLTVRLVVGHPDSAVTLSRAAGDSLLLRTRGNDLYLDRRDAQARRSSVRQLAGLGVFTAGLGVGWWAGSRGDYGTMALAILGGGLAGYALTASAFGPGADARVAWRDALERHRDSVAAHLLARRGRTLTDAASSTPALADCSWASCHLAVRPGFLGDRLVIGGSAEQGLGFNGTVLRERVRAVEAARPYADRYVRARGVANLLGVAGLMTALVLGNQANSAVAIVGPTAALLGASVLDARARRAAEEATWVYNRELLR